MGFGILSWFAGSNNAKVQMAPSVQMAPMRPPVAVAAWGEPDRMVVRAGRGMSERRNKMLLRRRKLSSFDASDAKRSTHYRHSHVFTAAGSGDIEDMRSGMW